MLKNLCALTASIAIAACATTPAPPAATAVSATRPAASLIDAVTSEEITFGYEGVGRAYAKQAFDKAAEFSEGLLRLNPGDPVLAYSVAMNYARAGQKEKALEALARLESMKSDLILDDVDFAGIATTPEYAAAKARIAANAPKFPAAQIAFRLDDREMIPEGIAWDPQQNALYVGSIHKRKIIRIAADGSSSEFASNLPYSVLGLRVDPERRALWVATSANEGFEVNDVGRAVLYRYDLTSGTRTEYRLGNNPPHLLNDIAIRADGTPLVTDSSSGAIFTIGDRKELEPFIRSGEFAYPDGIAVAPSGKIFVADFIRGISVIDPVSRQGSRLLHPRGVNFHGIDGLYFHQGALIGVQNGAGEGRIVRLPLNQEQTAVTGIEILHANDPNFDVPTTAAIAGDRLYVLANSQVRRVAPDGRLLDPDTLTPPVVLSIPLR